MNLASVARANDKTAPPEPPPSPDTVRQESGDAEYQVNVISSFPRWAQLAESWNALLTSSSANVIFLTWEWLYAWAECFWDSDCELFVLVVSRAGELVGIAPWCIRVRSEGFGAIRQIEFLGASDVASEYLDVFAKRGKEHDVAACIYNFLFGEARPRWDTLALTSILADSLFLLHLLEMVAEDGKHVEIEPGVFCPTLSLPKTQSALLGSLSAHRRERFRRDLRLLQHSGDVDHSTSTTREGVAASTLNALYSLRESKLGPDQAPFRRFLEQFLRRVHGKNWVQIDLLTVDGKPVAGFFQLRYGGTLSLYLVGTDKAASPKTSVGNVFIGLCLEKAIAENTAEYDFLRGSESYKFHWVTRGRRSLNVCLHQRRFTVLLLIGIRSVKALLKVILR